MNLKRNLKAENAGLFAALAIVSVTLILGALLLGRYPVSLATIFQVFRHFFGAAVENLPQQAISVVLYIRLPRVIAAYLVGSALACAGACGQGVFRNALVSPDILGAAAGASFGASLGILLNMPAALMQLCAFCSGLCAVVLTAFVNSRAGGRSSTLVLSGIMISSLCASLTSLVKIFADSEGTLPAITFWLLGSLTQITWKQTAAIALPIAVSFVPLFYLGWRLNVLSLGSEHAFTLGVPVKFLRAVFIVFSTVLTAAAVSVSGVIGWVGLLIPHAARFITGQDYRRVLPVSAALGGCFLLLIDTVSRTLTQAEIPLSVLTSLFGAPFFIVLITRSGAKTGGGSEA